MDKPTPITQTLQQQRALAHYLPMAEQAKRESAVAEVDGLLDRVRQSGTGECADHGDVNTWKEALMFWAGALSFLIGWGLVIAGTWLLAPSMTCFGEAFFRVMGGVR